MAASKISDYLRSEDTPLFLPVAYKDNSSLVDNFDIRYLNEGKRYVFKGYLAKPPSCKFKQKQPMTTFSITDGYLLLQFTLFGDVRSLVERLSLTPQEPIYVAGELANGPFINGAEVVDIEQIGTVKPVYPGIPGKVKPERMAAHIEKHILAFLPNAAQTIRAQLKNVFRSNAEIRQFLNVHSMTLEELLHCVHFPTSLADAEYALSVLKRIGEVAAASDLIELSRRASVPKAVQPIYGDDIGTLTANLPFSLTDEQYGIISRTIETIKQGILLDMVLIGDVGTGKTVCYAIPAAFVGTAGKRVAILLPNTNLATQIYTEFCSYFPTLVCKTLLVTGESGANSSELQAASVLIGTTAMLFRNIGQIDLCVVDEQQKMSSVQRQQLCSKQTHQINVSATPIPRTTALALYGAVRTEIIHHCHAKKTIHTRLFGPDKFQALIEDVIWTVNTLKKQALIVCAQKEENQSMDDTQNTPMSAEEAFAIFNQLMPGAVAMSHGGLSNEDNQTALESIRSGQKMILVATTVIEIGVTLPALTYAAVLDAERFGLNQLHQLRGRLVRTGGEGYFSMVVGRQLNPQTQRRLLTLTKSNDGHFIAREDLKLRGVGDLIQGTTQHGKYHGLLRNVDIDVEILERLVQQFAV